MRKAYCVRPHTLALTPRRVRRFARRRGAVFVLIGGEGDSSRDEDDDGITCGAVVPSSATGMSIEPRVERRRSQGKNWAPYAANHMM